MKFTDGSEPETLDSFCDGLGNLPEEYKNYYVQYVISYSVDTKNSSAVVFRLIGISTAKEVKNNLLYLVVDGRSFSYKGQARTQAEAYNLGCLLLRQNFPIKISHIANFWETPGITLCGLSTEELKESEELLVSEDNLSDEFYFCKECCKNYNWELIRRRLNDSILNIQLSSKNNDQR